MNEAALKPEIPMPPQSHQVLNNNADLRGDWMSRKAQVN